MDLLTRACEIIPRSAQPRFGRVPAMSHASSAPISTYRIQLTPDFGFAQARDIVDYLARLGITHVYVSPILRAERGSTHGYNIVDHGSLNVELGNWSDFAAFSDALAAQEMGLIVDWVPNHMGVGSGENAWWNDVLMHGPASRYAEFFDIDWDPPKPSLKNKVLLAVLGDRYGRALERGEVRLARIDGKISVHYYDRVFPTAPETWLPILAETSASLAMGPDTPISQELASIRLAVGHLPSGATDRQSAELRAHESDVVDRRLSALFSDHPPLAEAVDGYLDSVSSKGGDLGGLHALLSLQYYRLAFWRVAREEINYRRFFDINDLAAIRMEDDAVFTKAHALLFDLVRDGHVAGLRLDHTDGLYDPQGYFSRLRGALDTARHRGSYLVAEKILEPGESIPTTWAIDGTTGYDFLHAVSATLFEPQKMRRLEAVHRRFVGPIPKTDDLAFNCKLKIAQTSLASEVHVLARWLERIAMGDLMAYDFTLSSLQTAIEHVLACFPVYRTYVRANGTKAPGDTRYVDLAVSRARRRATHVDAHVFEFVRRVLCNEARETPRPLGEHHESTASLASEPGTDDLAANRLHFCLRFQQLSGAVMAKGVEDTAFYRDVRWPALLDVGCPLDVEPWTLDAFHDFNQRRLHALPRSMSTTATHDTKRGEDVRARLSTLAEYVDEWAAFVAEASSRAAALRSDEAGESAPSARDEYFFYQTVVGTLPFDADATAWSESYADRIANYILKAAREAKLETSWVNPNEPYEAELESFVRAMMKADAFQRAASHLVGTLRSSSVARSLAQVVLKLMSPGVPDTYQGNELWDLSLVDPDNRRPVDFDVRREILSRTAGASDRGRLARELYAEAETGAIKCFVTSTLLSLRRSQPATLSTGGYARIAGPDEVAAFSRSAPEEARVIVAVTRFPRRVSDGPPIGDRWGDAALELADSLVGTYTDALTGQEHELAGATKLRELFSELPVAVLVENVPAAGTA